MQTAKSLGFKKGDFVMTGDGNFPAILVSDVHTATPCAEVWGWEHESGSTYAHMLRRITKEEFLEKAKACYGGVANEPPYSQVAKDALK